MPSRTGKKVYVAMSGGVDSSVTAALLKYGGFSARGGPASGGDVRGVHIKMWSPTPSSGSGQADPVCRQQYHDRLDATRVAAHLDIPFETWDLTKEYKKEVVEYMIKEYAAGRTPNPDVMCNRHIKFGVFLKKALEQGADYIATGHYVRAVPSAYRPGNTLNMPRAREIKLLKGVDGNKDQSYFLWTLTQEQLKHCLFPVGDYTKPEVRALAQEYDLPTAQKPDSQGICFIGEINIREFLKNYIPAKRGPVLTTSGKKVGEHEGLAFYTLGQREGLGTGGGGVPYYVADKDFSRNVLLVAEGPYDEKLFAQEAGVAEINWISGRKPKLPLRCEARVRYRQPLQSCTIVGIRNQESGIRNGETITPNSQFLVQFKEPQRAVTPGQSVVFYQGEPFDHAHGREMLGGGIIQ